MRAGAPFNESLDAGVAGLDTRERRLAHALAAGVLRAQRRLDAALDLTRVDPRLHDILRLGAFQLRELERVPSYAAVSTSVDLARREAGAPAAKFVNQALRKLAAGTGSPRRETRSHPDWLLARWVAHFGAADAARLAAWNDATPPVTLQPARWTLEQLRAALQASGYGVEDAPFGTGLRLVRGAHDPRPSQLPGYAEGGFLVQDPAAVLVCRFAGVPHGSLVLDACAAPGGKAVTIERLGSAVRIVAADPRRDRLPRLAGTARRCGVAIRLVAADLVSSPLAPGSVDVVLVDAPCTATGTMARHPDARWRISTAAIARAARRQQTLLAAGAALVRQGGILIYATCSLEPEENVAVVEEFLRTHREFHRAPPGIETGPPLTAAGDFQSLPQRDGIDGAYAARLARTGGRA